MPRIGKFIDKDEWLPGANMMGLKGTRVENVPKLTLENVLETEVHSVHE